MFRLDLVTWRRSKLAQEAPIEFERELSHWLPSVRQSGNDIAVAP